MVNEIVKEDVLEAEEIEKDQYLVFTSKSQEFGIQAMRVHEISAPLGITKIPNTPAHIDGIMNLRGRLVSVIDFRKKFRFEFKGHDEDTRVIIVECSGFPTGIIVDSVEEVIKIPDEKVQKLPEGVATSISQEYITGVGMLDNRLIILLDTDKVLTESDLSELEAARQTMEYMQTSQKTGADGKDAETTQTNLSELEAARQTVEYMQASQKTGAGGKDAETTQTKTKETKRRVKTVK